MNTPSMTVMALDELEAAWAAVQDATPTARCSPYDAAMGVGRWRWLLVPVVVLVAGCLPRPDQPPSFLAQGQTFTEQPPPPGETGQEIAAELRKQDPGDVMLQGRAIPVYGFVDCHGNRDCIRGSPTVPGGRGPVWVLSYPDCEDADTGEVGWAFVSAKKGVDSGHKTFSPCIPQAP